MTIWLALLAGCVVCGAAIVAVLVLPRGAALLAALTGLLSFAAAIAVIGQISETYVSPEALALATLVLVLGVAGGFAVAAAALPHLAYRPHAESVATSTRCDDGAVAVVLVCNAEPERYSPTAVAARQNLLAEGAGIEIPVTALPFVFFADKARYRAVGGRAPGPAVAGQLAVRVAERLGDRVARVETAWCHDPRSLASTVSSLAQTGMTSVSVVILGATESGPLDQTRALLDRVVRDGSGPRIAFSPPVWNDRLLPARLAQRILAVTVGATPEETGVVLVDEGVPPAWERKYAAAGAVENYFDQRVRMLLGEAGIMEQHVRVAWLDWQTPDVTETVRHLAALGCTRIVVAASTLALPTLETVLDIPHAITLARVPDGVQVVTVSPWGDDEGLVDAICASALESLGLSRADP